jgi:hypothetical protein
MEIKYASQKHYEIQRTRKMYCNYNKFLLINNCTCSDSFIIYFTASLQIKQNVTTFDITRFMNLPML